MFFKFPKDYILFSNMEKLIYDFLFVYFFFIKIRYTEYRGDAAIRTKDKFGPKF